MSNKLEKDKVNSNDEKNALSYRNSSLLNNHSRKYDFKYLFSTILILFIAFVLVFLNNSSLNSFLIPTLSKQNLHTTDQNQMAQSAENNDAWKHAKTIYEFQAPDIDGKLVDLSKYK
jgi:hypothetical protein